MADQYTRKIANVVRDNASVQYLYSPALNGAGAGGAAVAAGAGAWGAYVDLIAAGGVTVEFWVCGIACYTHAAAQVTQLQLYRTALTTTIANFMFDPTAVTVNVTPMMVPFPIYEPANAQIQARAGGAAAKAIACHCIYAIGF